MDARYEIPDLSHISETVALGRLETKLSTQCVEPQLLIVLDQTYGQSNSLNWRFFDCVDMVSYVAYRASAESKDRGRITQRLRALECRRVCRSFWTVNEKETKNVLRVLRKNRPVLLKRIREVRKPRFARGKGLRDVGSLVVISYGVPKDVKREKIRNFLGKAPYIRLCRGVYAFYQEHKRFDKNRELVDGRRFFEFIREIGEDVKVFPRMVAVNSDSVQELMEEARKRVEKEVEDIIIGYEGLCQKIKEGEIDKQQTQKTLSKLRRRFATTKKIAAFYEKWLKIDFSKSLIKPYRAIRKAGSLVDQEQRRPLRFLRNKSEAPTTLLEYSRG